jgi:hypothetical protein
MVDRLLSLSMLPWLAGIDIECYRTSSGMKSNLYSTVADEKKESLCWEEQKKERQKQRYALQAVNQARQSSILFKRAARQAFAMAANAAIAAQETQKALEEMERFVSVYYQSMYNISVYSLLRFSTYSYIVYMEVRVWLAARNRAVLERNSVSSRGCWD